MEVFTGVFSMDVLVAEDSPVYRKLLERCLQEWGFRHIIVNDGSEAWRLLQRGDSPRLLLLDWVLPGVDGVELCRRVRAQGLKGNSYSYIVLLTGKDAKEEILEAMQAGVDDYLVKPFDEWELRARLNVGKRILELSQQLVEARESMRHAASHDSLTGVMNRAEILESLSRELERGHRNNKPVGIILADLDHFKNVNDTLGHLFSDEALREVARRLRSCLRVYDSVGRYGGEEFLLILPGCDLMTTIIRADQIRTAVADQPVIWSQKSRFITASMGVTCAAPGNVDVHSLLRQVDKGLSEAKRKGRNRVEHWEDASAESLQPSLVR
jgi:diguanylate cyclase (GGDEF)-like protein